MVNLEILWWFKRPRLVGEHDYHNIFPPVCSCCKAPMKREDEDPGYVMVCKFCAGQFAQFGTD